MSDETFNWLLNMQIDSTLQEINSLKDDIDRLLRAQKMMQAANFALYCGDDEALRQLGFTQKHIAELKTRNQAGLHGFPAYAMSNNNKNIRALEDSLKCLQKKHMTSRVSRIEALDDSVLKRFGGRK